MERYSARVNLDQKLSKYVKMGINLNVSRNEYDNVPLGDGQNENAGILVSAAQFNPALPIRDENGDYSMTLMPLSCRTLCLCWISQTRQQKNAC